MELDIDDDII